MIREAVHGCDLSYTGGRPAHWHDDWQLCEVVSGDGWLRVGGTKHLTPVGTLFIVPPGEVHANDTFETGCEYRSMLVSPDAVEEVSRTEGLMADAGVCVRQPVFAQGPLPNRYLHFHQAFFHGVDNLDSECVFADLLTNLFARLTDRPVEHHQRRPHPAVQTAREILWDEAECDLSLSDLADRCGLSRFELVRQFKAAYGLPPHSWRTQARIIRAKRLLRAGTPIAEVALRTGFADQAHLTRTFRKATGTTPGNYADCFRNILQDTNPTAD